MATAVPIAVCFVTGFSARSRALIVLRSSSLHRLLKALKRDNIRTRCDECKRLGVFPGKLLLNSAAFTWIQQLISRIRRSAKLADRVRSTEEVEMAVGFLTEDEERETDDEDPLRDVAHGVRDRVDLL